MANEIINSAHGGSGSPKKEPWYQAFIDPLAALFWVYLIVNVFFYDIDALLIRNLPLYLSWIILYKFFVLIGGLAILWLFTKSGRVIGYFFYILY